jgi:uncharacterized repeat protein (TIGR03803 family)
VATTCQAGAQQYKVLHSFDHSNGDGYYPLAGVIFDQNGNIYGTTNLGGTNRGGVAFELIEADGWTENILHNFVYNTGDSDEPFDSLVLDKTGTPYGTAFGGGASGSGTVFKLTDTSAGWTETIIHSFGLNQDGMYPYGKVIFDGAGNLYGTTLNGGGGWGTVFEMTPNGDAGWSEKLLHRFSPFPYDGYYPVAGLTLDAKGNLYGTTQNGGNCSYSQGCGTVFELTLTAGVWSEKVIHNFEIGGDGLYPSSGVIFDTFGNLYGTTPMGGKGGNYGNGTVYELKPNADGSWVETLLHEFGGGSDGEGPMGGLVLDSAGNLYGTTDSGGLYNGGTIFELSPSASGGWKKKILHNFEAKGGTSPQAGLVFYGGNLYGTTAGGGDHLAGTVFEITP